jgi:eukaryotic-like serine/threonine-protein kinase
MPAAVEVVDRYRIERALGQGASATVYLAQDQHSGQWVALKVLANQGPMASAERTQLRTRFLQEAEIVRRLQHPDIVAVQAVGETKGSLWLAMDLAPGRPLDHYLQKRTLLPPQVVLRIGVRVARALAHAHKQGVVHRDVKPSNVLIDLATESVKLTDFGTARLLDSRRTGTEFILGTPAYMAPELLAGNSASVASDLYSLGVVVFELLTARRPHQSASMGELLRQVAREPAPELRSLRPEAPAVLAATLARLLNKRANDRPANADEAAAALARALAAWPAPGAEASVA